MTKLSIFLGMHLYMQNYNDNQDSDYKGRPVPSRAEYSFFFFFESCDTGSSYTSIWFTNHFLYHTSMHLYTLLP